MILLCILSLISVAYAHPGQTDDNGGHYDHSTGEYHYHHGYSAHDHYDMDGDGDIDCPFDFDDNTRTDSKKEPNQSSYSSDYFTTSSTQAGDTAKPPVRTQKWAIMDRIYLIVLVLIGVPLTVLFLFALFPGPLDYLFQIISRNAEDPDKVYWCCVISEIMIIQIVLIYLIFRLK